MVVREVVELCDSKIVAEFGRITVFYRVTHGPRVTHDFSTLLLSITQQPYKLLG